MFVVSDTKLFFRNGDFDSIRVAYSLKTAKKRQVSLPCRQNCVILHDFMFKAKLLLKYEFRSRQNH